MATIFPFPPTPTVGQQVTLADGVTKMVWTGYSWEVVPVPYTLPMPISDGGTGATSVSGARSNLGLGSQGPVSGFRNRIINPSGAVRVRASNSTGVGNTYISDRWFIGLLGGAVGLGVQAGSSNDIATDFANTPYAGDNVWLLSGTTALSSPAAGDHAYIAQRFALEQIADFRLCTAYCKPMVLSFVARTKPGMSSFVLSVALVNGAADRSFVQNVTINETAQKYTLAIPPITSGSTGLTSGGVAATVFFTPTAGTTYRTPTPGAWANGVYIGAAGMGNLLGVTGNYFRITEVQLEEGTVPTAFEVRPYGTEELLCQRYFQKGYTIAIGYGGAGNNFGVWVPLRPTTRINPTVATVSDTTSNCSASSQIFNSYSNGFFLLRSVITAGIAQFNDNWTADAELS